MINPENIYHVYPLHDTYEHLLAVFFPPIGIPQCKCICKPTYQQQGEGLLIIHNSFDGREGVEWTREILNKP
jgi:hypothetical protein